MKLGDRRTALPPAFGSRSNGTQTRHKAFRVAISFDTQMVSMLHAEARIEGLPFAEIVRRRVRASYSAERANTYDELPQPGPMGPWC